MAIGDNFIWDPDGIIKGETNDLYFSKLKAFEIHKWNFKVDNGSARVSSPKGPGQLQTMSDSDSSSEVGVIPGKLKFQEIEIDKSVDSASVLLYKACCIRDKPIPTLMMATRASGGEPLLYLQYIFRLVQLTSIKWDGGSGTERAKETFAFSFKAMGMQYVQQGPDGKQVSTGPLSWVWNIVNLDANGKGTSSLDVVKGGKVPDFLDPNALAAAPPKGGR
jgi:type VI protein secretion system component Hcp